MRIFTVEGDIPDDILQTWLNKAEQEGWAASCVEVDDRLTLANALGVLRNSVVGQSLRRHGFVMLTDLAGVPVEQFLTLLAEAKALIERQLVSVFQAMADRHIAFADGGDPEDFMAITVRPEHLETRFYKLLKRAGLLSYALVAQLSDEFFKNNVQFLGEKTIGTLRLRQAEYLKR